ncbi:hypothetical protein GNI_212640, partial [Gregarina niphandrodes]
NIPPGGWKLCMVDSVRPIQLLSLWKSFKVVGAMVAVKRHQPSPIVFDGSIAQVAHQELWWAPWSGVDEPMIHPRQMASAILVGDNWTSKYIRNSVPVSQRFHYDNRDPKGGIEQVVEFFKAGSPPWLPIDRSGQDDAGKDSGKFASQQSIGYFYVDGPTNSRVTVDVELKLTIALKGRKCLGGKVDESGPINANNAGVSIGNEDIGSNLGADLPVEDADSVD